MRARRASGRWVQVALARAALGSQALAVTTATSQYYRFNSYTQVNVRELLDPAVAAMVPEPSTYALTALGLLGVAGAAHRRKA